MRWKLGAKLLLGGVLSLGLGTLLVRRLAYWPWPVQAEVVTNAPDAPLLRAGQSLTVMTYNVQYMAGKKYFFFYDGGPHTRPGAADVALTITEIARLIQAENPDVVLLQEVDEGAKRTDHQDQATELLALLPAEYGCMASAFYWKADFVPHPEVWGAAGMKLVILSKYQICGATRYQLPTRPGDPLSRAFRPKQAILEAQLPLEDGAGKFSVINTHLEAFGQGTSVLAQQVAQLGDLLRDLNAAEQGWVLGGDFNALPPGQRAVLAADLQAAFNPETELAPLYKQQAIIPDMTGWPRAEQEPWFTFVPNDPRFEQQPVYTLDHLFCAPAMAVLDRYVRREEALTLSDHLPLLATVQIPG